MNQNGTEGKGLALQLVPELIDKKSFKRGNHNPDFILAGSLFIPRNILNIVNNNEPGTSGIERANNSKHGFQSDQDEHSLEIEDPNIRKYIIRILRYYKYDPEESLMTLREASFKIKNRARGIVQSENAMNKLQVWRANIEYSEVESEEEVPMAQACNAVQSVPLQDKLNLNEALEHKKTKSFLKRNFKKIISFSKAKKSKEKEKYSNKSISILCEKPTQSKEKRKWLTRRKKMKSEKEIIENKQVTGPFSTIAMKRGETVKKIIFTIISFERNDEMYNKINKLQKMLNNIYYKMISCRKVNNRTTTNCDLNFNDKLRPINSDKYLHLGTKELNGELLKHEFQDSLIVQYLMTPRISLSNDFTTMPLDIEWLAVNRKHMQTKSNRSRRNPKVDKKLRKLEQLSGADYEFTECNPAYSYVEQMAKRTYMLPHLHTCCTFKKSNPQIFLNNFSKTSRPYNIKNTSHRQVGQRNSVVLDADTFVNVVDSPGKPNCSVEIIGEGYRGKFNVGLDPVIDNVVYRSLQNLKETCQKKKGLYKKRKYKQHSLLNSITGGIKNIINSKPSERVRPLVPDGRPRPKCCSKLKNLKTSIFKICSFSAAEPTMANGNKKKRVKRKVSSREVSFEERQFRTTRKREMSNHSKKKESVHTKKHDFHNSPLPMAERAARTSDIRKKYCTESARICVCCDESKAAERHKVLFDVMNEIKIKLESGNKEKKTNETQTEYSRSSQSLFSRKSYVSRKKQSMPKKESRLSFPLKSYSRLNKKTMSSGYKNAPFNRDSSQSNRRSVFRRRSTDKSSSLKKERDPLVSDSKKSATKKTSIKDNGKNKAHRRVSLNVSSISPLSKKSSELISTPKMLDQGIERSSNQKSKDSTRLSNPILRRSTTVSKTTTTTTTSSTQLPQDNLDTNNSGRSNSKELNKLFLKSKKESAHHPISYRSSKYFSDTSLVPHSRESATKKTSIKDNGKDKAHRRVSLNVSPVSPLSEKSSELLSTPKMLDQSIERSSNQKSKDSTRLSNPILKRSTTQGPSESGNRVSKTTTTTTTTTSSTQLPRDNLDTNNSGRSNSKEFNKLSSKSEIESAHRPISNRSSQYFSADTSFVSDSRESTTKKTLIKDNGKDEAQRRASLNVSPVSPLSKKSSKLLSTPNMLVQSIERSSNPKSKDLTSLSNSILKRSTTQGPSETGNRVSKTTTTTATSTIQLPEDNVDTNNSNAKDERESKEGIVIKFEKNSSAEEVENSEVESIGPSHHISYMRPDSPNRNIFKDTNSERISSVDAVGQPSIAQLDMASINSMLGVNNSIENVKLINNTVNISTTMPGANRTAADLGDNKWGMIGFNTRYDLQDSVAESGVELSNNGHKGRNTTNIVTRQSNTGQKLLRKKKSLTKSVNNLLLRQSSSDLILNWNPPVNLQKHTITVPKKEGFSGKTFSRASKLPLTKIPKPRVEADHLNVIKRPPWNSSNSSSLRTTRTTIPENFITNKPHDKVKEDKKKVFR